MNRGTFICLLLAMVLLLTGTFIAPFLESLAIRFVLVLYGFGLVALWGAVVLHLAIDHKQ